MKRNLRDFVSAISSLRISRTTKPALWVTIGGLIFLASAQPTAYGLDFPMTTRLALPSIYLSQTDGKNLVGGGQISSVLLSSQLAEMAIVATVSEQVEMARTIDGAKKVTKAIMDTDYSWGDDQYTCLNQLWSRESHWNYKAHNYRSGAHGIAQALPAEKMEVISDDWRTNPVTQIQWGLRYIELRYDDPCNAWAKWRSHRYY